MCICIYVYAYVYVLHVYEERTWRAENNAMHILRSSPIGCEGFVQPQKGQGKARLNEYYEKMLVTYIYVYFIHSHLPIYILSINIDRSLDR